MYATSGLNEVIGISAEAMRGRSFYYCIAENCLQDAVKCLENAKGNDSIAYLRFWFRDPRQDDQPLDSDESSDEEMTTDTSEDGGVHLRSESGDAAGGARPISSMDVDSDESHKDSRHSSGDSTRGADTHEAIFGQALRADSSTSSLPPSPTADRNTPPQAEPIELEAVISCTSDGLVVCLRRARPMIPHPTQRPGQPVHQNGLFAAPWAHEPVLPPMDARAGTGYANNFAPALGPQGARRDSSNLSPTAVAPQGQMDFMAAIREQAVFAWALTGINGCLAEYGHGKPSGESLPLDGLPVWENDPKKNVKFHRNNGGFSSGADVYSQQDGRPGTFPFGDPGLDRNNGSGSRGVSSTSSGNNSSRGTPFTPGPGAAR